MGNLVLLRLLRFLFATRETLADFLSRPAQAVNDLPAGHGPERPLARNRHLMRAAAGPQQDQLPELRRRKLSAPQAAKPASKSVMLAGSGIAATSIGPI